MGCRNLKSITLGKNLKTIESYAFTSSGLTSINIPASVTSIGDDVFYNCDDLKTITISSENKTYSSKNANMIYENASDKIIYVCDKSTKVPQGTKIIGQSVFSQSPIKTLDLPCSLETIEEGAFYGSSLTSVKIPEGVETIGPRAFQDCKNLKSVYLPTNIKLENNAFAYNDNLTDIYYAGTEAGWGITSANSNYGTNSDGSTQTALFSLMEKTEAVNGLSYDKKSNTLTMKNFAGKILSINEMGDDFVIKVKGTNNLSKLWVWGYGYCGSVKLTGNGSLNIKMTEAPELSCLPKIPNRSCTLIRM